MRLTDADVKLFRALYETDTARFLIDYLERLTSDMCDARKMKDTDEVSVKANVLAAERIEKDIINRIKVQTKEKEPVPHPYS